MSAVAHKAEYPDPCDTQGVARGVLCSENGSYPQSLKEILGKKSPATLNFIGNTSLLEKAGVGFCGSRNASDKGLETARDCAEQIAGGGFNVISGYAPGVDMAAHHTALAVGGTTIIVLPEGIEHFRVKKALHGVWDWSKVLVLSHCKPHEIWQAYHAMNRNQIIIALSKAMIVIEAQEKGGTIEAGKSALKLRMPLFVAEYGDMDRTPGNDLLLQHGGVGLRKSKSEGRAKLSSLFGAIERFSYPVFASESQLNLI